MLNTGHRESSSSGTGAGVGGGSSTSAGDVDARAAALIDAQHGLMSTTVTVFGFPPEKAAAVMNLFQSVGEVVRRIDGGCGNWVHIQYKRAVHANMALSHNGKLVDGEIMIGVKRVDASTFRNLHAADALLRSSLNGAGAGGAGGSSLGGSMMMGLNSSRRSRGGGGGGGGGSNGGAHLDSFAAARAAAAEDLNSFSDDEDEGDVSVFERHSRVSARGGGNHPAGGGAGPRSRGASRNIELAASRPRRSMCSRLLEYLLNW